MMSVNSDMQFRNLTTADVGTLTRCSNICFSDYEIPMQWTIDSMQQKIQNEDICLPLSVGVWDGPTMAGFILVGYKKSKQLAWDGGTGVIPTHRGQKLTEQMFAFLSPALRNEGVKLMLLEVLQNNTGAYKVYERIGFRKTRLLHAYKGQIRLIKEYSYKIEHLTSYNADALLSLADWQPAWQQMNKRVLNRGNSVTTIAIRDGESIAAYMHYDAITGRVHQFGVGLPYRRRGMASALFSYMATNNSKPITIVNVDDASENTNSFIRSLGIDYMISQYEMTMPIGD